MGVSYAIDVSKLDVCFGGFTPMALSDGLASQAQVLEAQRRAQERRELAERAAALEAARASEERAFRDEAGNVWTYVVLDGATVRVERCEAHAADLVIPSAIEGKPVVALAADACANLPAVESVTCPDTLLSIGFCAFRFDKSLRSVVFPKNLTTFDSHWLRGSNKVEHLVLPGQLAKLDARIFDAPSLRTLVIGAGTDGIEPGTFAKSKLERVEVDKGNPFLMTDGQALYSSDGTVLVALVVPVEEYRVRAGCRAIAKKGFSNFACVRRIEVPQGLEMLGEFALSRTSICAFDAPSSLVHIREKAFFSCSELVSVSLKEGLLSVGSNAFTETSLRELRLPSSIEELGHPLADRCGLTYAGPGATFSIAKGERASEGAAGMNACADERADAGRLELDEEGALYRRDADGVHLVRMMNPDAVRYVVRAGTTCIDAGAFAKHGKLAEVVMPEGLLEIGDGAFRACRSLVAADIPKSTRRIGDEAFLETSLVRVVIPASLEHLGENALVTYGAHHGKVRPSLQSVQVDEGSERFYTVPGLLIERKKGGRERVVLFAESTQVVRVPESVDEIAPYALSGARGVSELYLSDRIRDVGIRGLAVDDLVDHIHVDLESPVAGHEFFDWHFPHTDRGTQQQMLALSVPRFVDVEALFEHYDNSIVNASSFDARSNAGLDAYEQAVRIVERLRDPVFLTSVNRSLCDRVLGGNIEEICVAVAKHDDRVIIDALLDLGYLNEDNLYAVIDRVGAVQDASMTSYLLEVRRMRFSQAALDFDL